MLKRAFAPPQPVASCSGPNDVGRSDENIDLDDGTDGGSERRRKKTATTTRRRKDTKIHSSVRGCSPLQRSLLPLARSDGSAAATAARARGRLLFACAHQPCPKTTSMSSPCGGVDGDDDDNPGALGLPKMCQVCSSAASSTATSSSRPSPSSSSSSPLEN